MKALKLIGEVFHDLIDSPEIILWLLFWCGMFAATLL